jgi:hypothetical protein
VCQRTFANDLVVAKKISIALREENSPPSIQVQRLAKNHKALFKAMRNDLSLSTADEKVAALALLQSHRLKVGDGNIRLENWSSEAYPDDQPHRGVSRRGGRHSI